ncbi:MAG: putative toxin-antitoxin system toxin component, PIN family [bacterium]|nr:putative toxin-antitoxin system toxin component, PIN family [bacterium]
MKRVVLDTNVLVSSAYDDLSASWKIVEACLRGELTAVVSPALRSEYEEILARTVNIRGHEEQMRAFLAATETVRPASVPHVVEDDPEDDKVIATAVAGRADALVTNDRHLLTLDPYRPEDDAEPIRIVRPVTFEQLRSEERGDGWQDLARLIGIR